MFSLYLDDEDNDDKDVAITIHNDESNASYNDRNESDAELSEEETVEKIVEYDSEENEIEVNLVSMFLGLGCYESKNVFFCIFKRSRLCKKRKLQIFSKMKLSFPMNGTVPTKMNAIWINLTLNWATKMNSTKINWYRNWTAFTGNLLAFADCTIKRVNLHLNLDDECSIKMLVKSK